MKQNYKLRAIHVGAACRALLIINLLSCLFSTGIYAQVTVSESFNALQFPPFGWQQIPIYGVNTTNLFDRITVGTLGPASPHSGAGFVRYRSRTALPPAASCLVSKRLDLSGRATCNAATTVSFWLYRDSYLPGSQDTIRVFIDTANTYFSNTRVLLSGPGPSPLLRPYTSAPAVTANTWQQYTYNLPAGHCTDHEYIMIVTGSAGGGNTYIDDFSVTTWPSPQVLNTTFISYQDITPVSKGATTQVITGINVKMTNSGTPALSMDSIALNTNGTSSLSDIQNAKLWYTGGSNIFSSVQQVGTTIANVSTTAPFPGNLVFKLPSFGTASLVAGQKYVVAGGAGCTLTHNSILYSNGQVFTAANAFYVITANPTGNCTALSYFPMEVGDNYFWLTYDVLAGATAGNCADAEYSGCYLAETGILNLSAISTMTGCREISADYCNGTIPVLSWGTSEQSDFVRHIALWGEASVTPALPHIDNSLNSHGPNSAPYFGGPAPFCSHPPDYELFPAVPGKTCVLKQGTTYAAPAVAYAGPGLTIQADADVGFDPNYVNAWIDFNHDGDFIDPGEQLIPAAVPLYGLTVTNRAVTVPIAGGVSSPGVIGPAGSIVGTTRLRVRASESVPALDPCTGGLVEGETEDYLVTIMPNCQAGVKTWLGFTDDWNVPANWCGGVPTINDIALVQFAASGTPASGYHKPFIHTGVTATAQTIRLASGDTLYVDAQNNASLTIRDSLNINYSGPGNGHIKVISSYSNTATISNGTLNFNITPFEATRKNKRMQIVYTASDFASQGINAGDVIDELWFDIYSRATTPAFAGIYYGFTISYAYCSGGWNAWPGPPPAALATAGAYTSFYSGNLDLNAPVISGGLGSPSATGNLKIAGSSFIYAGGDMVFNICYNNSLLGIASVLTNDLIRQTVTTNAYRVMWINSNFTSAPNYGCVLGFPITPGNSGVTSIYRPNITFKYHKTFNTFPITIGTGAASVNGVTVLAAPKGHWVNGNNGATLKDGFEAGRSSVTFSGIYPNQNITGVKSTLFNELGEDKLAGTLTQVLAATVDSGIILTNGAFLLNSLTLSHNNGKASSVTRTNGYLVSEDPAALGKMAWNIGTADLGVNHNFPFGRLGGTYIPVSVNPTADIGVVSIATYNTVWANTPYPSPATHVNNVSGAPNNGTLTVDRFWVLDKTGPPANNATVNFSYDNAEANAPNVINKATLTAQRWVGAGWAGGLGTSAVGGSVSSQNVIGVNSNFNGPWALTDVNNPLPIELLEFNAVALTDKVKIWWKTASETNNDYFTVERTTDARVYDFIAHVASKGNGPMEHAYEVFDLQPLMGLQYYRLKTTSINKEEEFSKLVPVKFNNKPIFDITSTASLYEAGLLGIDYISDSNLPCKLKMYDITGKIIVTKSNIVSVTGYNHIDLGLAVTHGVYLLTIENSEHLVSKKVVY